MEGPTPVSAMIHAATMVTAGLYLLLRTSFVLVLSPAALEFTFIIGVLTVLVTSLIGIWHYDIKKIIAFSTCSQLGYMMAIIGSSYFSLGFFHLLTHAFFKALLFLAAGVVIHRMKGEQDLRRLAGAFSTNKQPRKFFTRFGFDVLQVAFLIGVLSLAGIFFFSGFYSKELILFSLATSSNSTTSLLAELVLNISVFLTAYYSFRMY
jgi:NADH:ubiquinone oxidoreductase subunit 5 (subunit L)/multisubunit Na+/H+ antiporter MnhA subunit